MRSSPTTTSPTCTPSGMGRPSIPPSVMVRAMLCATHDRILRRRDVPAHPGRRRLEGGHGRRRRVRRYRCDHVQPHAQRGWSPMTPRTTLFEKTFEKAVAAGDLQRQADRHHRLLARHRGGSGGRHLRAGPGLPAQGGPGRRRPPRGEEARSAAEPFCGAKPDIDWQDPAARKAHLGELVGAARAVLAGVDSTTRPWLRGRVAGSGRGPRHHRGRRRRSGNRPRSGGRSHRLVVHTPPT